MVRIIAVVVWCSLVSCARIDIPPADLQIQLKKGQTADDVETLLGKAPYDVPFDCEDAGVCRVWTYWEGANYFKVLFHRQNETWVVSEWRNGFSEGVSRSSARSACRFSNGMRHALATSGGTRPPPPEDCSDD